MGFLTRRERTKMSRIGKKMMGLNFWRRIWRRVKIKKKMEREITAAIIPDLDLVKRRLR